MSKLTKNIREQMARKLVAYRYTDEAKELVKLNRTLADRVYTHVYTKPILDAVAVIQKAFPNAIIKDRSLSVNAGGWRLELGEQLHSRWVKFEHETHKGYAQVRQNWETYSITDEKLAEEVKAFATRKRNFGDVCETAYYEALSVLNTITTGKKLAEAWPEAIPVIGDLIPEGSRTLPVVQVSAINTKFGLPPEKADA